MSFFQLVLSIVAANLLTLTAVGGVILLIARTARAPEGPQQRLVRRAPVV